MNGPQNLIIEWSTPSTPFTRPRHELIPHVTPSQIRGILAMFATLRGRSRSGQQRLDVMVSQPNQPPASITAENNFYVTNNDQILFRATPDSGPIFNELQHFDPATEPFILIYLLDHDQELRRARHWRARYVALFRGPGNILVVQYLDPEYLQGAVSVSNWLGYDYHEVIPVVYDGTQAMTIV
jgi:hypothetical protein